MPNSLKRRRGANTRMAAAAIAVAACALAAGCVEPRDYPRPNILLVTIDTLRADHVGAYGYEPETTPEIDRVAAEGVVFEDAVSVSSWTLPGHASIMTGLFPYEHGVEKDINALPPSAVTLAETLKDEGYETFAAISHVYMTRRWGFDQGFDEYDQGAALGSPQRPVAEKVVNSALEWLGARSERGDDASGDPFFMWLHIFDPHWDYAPPPPYDTRFDPDYRGRMRGDYQSIKRYIKEVARYEEPPPMAARDLRHLFALYDGEIAYTDAHLGRLFASLRESGSYDDTLIVVTSDHGEEFMEHGSLEGHQWTLYEEVVKVPLIMRLPEAGCAENARVVRGARIAEPVSHVGVSGTVLDCIGVENERPSLYGLLGGGESDSTAVSTLLLDLTARHTQRTLALRTRNHKMIRNPDGSEEFYTAPRIGNETPANRASTGQAAEVVMRGELERRLGNLERLSDAGAIRDTLDRQTVERLRATGYLD